MLPRGDTPQQPSSTAAVSHLGLDNSMAGGCAAHSRIFSSTVGLYPLGASRTSPSVVIIKKSLQTLPNAPWCAKWTPVENQWSADQRFPTCVPQTSSTHITQEPIRNAGFLPHLRLTTYESVFSVAVQFSSVSQSCPTLCEAMNRSTPGFPVLHHLPELAQTHVRKSNSKLLS